MLSSNKRNVTISVLAIVVVAFGIGILYISQDNSADVLVNDDNNPMIDKNKQKDFVFAFYSEVADKDKQSNLFFSPFSISTAFSMAYEGAMGKTASEMQEVFGFIPDDQERKESISDTLERLNSKDDLYKLQIANALWIKEKLSNKTRIS